jgi:hypothetical protein
MVSAGYVRASVGLSQAAEVTENFRQPYPRLPTVGGAGAISASGHVWTAPGCQGF